MNKLWVCRSTAENIERAEKYEYFKANERYCLVITDETPEKMAEVSGDAAKSLTQQDWAWITAVGEKIKADKEYEEFTRQTEDFLNRFEAELKKKKEGLTDGRDPGGGTEEY